MINHPFTFVTSKSPEAAWLYALLAQFSPSQQEILVPLMIGFGVGMLVLSLVGAGLAILAGPFLLSYLASEIVPPTYPLILK